MSETRESGGTTGPCGEGLDHPDLGLLRCKRRTGHGHLHIASHPTDPTNDVSWRTDPALGWTDGWVGEMVLGCGHGWIGETDSREEAERLLGLFMATNDTAWCSVCGSQQVITGPVREVARG